MNGEIYSVRKTNFTHREHALDSGQGLVWASEQDYHSPISSFLHYNKFSACCLQLFRKTREI